MSSRGLSFTTIKSASFPGSTVPSLGPTPHISAAFLVAAIMLHHLTGAGDFAELMGTGSWPDGQASISEQHALFIGLLLLFAAAGKLKHETIVAIE